MIPSLGMKYNLVFLDTETTGNGPQDRLCQLSYKRSTDTYDSMVDELFKPPMPIPVEAMAIHHVTNRMVADKPAFLDSPLYPEIKKFLEDPLTVIVAHNAPFDRGILEHEDIHATSWIDTLRIMRFLDPTMIVPRQNLQYLRYLLELDTDSDIVINPHDAKSDVIIVELLFRRFFTKMKEKTPEKSDDEIVDDMITISKTPALIAKFTFGKYKDKRVEEVAQQDPGYLQWLLEQKKNSDNNEEDWIHTLEHFLKT